MLDFHALIPALSDKCGHEFPYQKSIQSTLNELGIAYTAHLVKRSQLETVPPNWHLSLHWKTFSNKWRQFLPRFFECSKLLQRAEGERRVFFLDRFTLTDVIPVLIAFGWRGKKEDRLCIQVRIESKWRSLYRALFRWNKQLFLICDSELLAADYENCAIFPLPFAAQLAPKELEEKILLLCPGDRRKEKGGALVEALFRSERIEIKEGKPLTREEYIEQFKACDGVLLPYDPKAYRKRSSGVFVEAIIAGRPPFVSDRTWLAYELRKYQLTELIVDFENRNLLGVIEKTLHSPPMRSKLHAMREAYLKFHTPAGLKASFEALFSAMDT